MEIVVLILTFIYFSKIIYEKIELKKNRNKIKTVIHINGIRGKSTISRLIDAGLRDEKKKIFTKITGTEPRYIDIDGVEKKIFRRGLPNIREQIKFIKKAANLGVDILILECMAVNPELQKICEEKIVKSNITLITNVREDHLDEMGETLDEIAFSLSLTIPENGFLFTADKRYFEFFKECAKKKNTKTYLVTAEEEEYREIDFIENVGLALKICEHLGVKKEIALQRMKEYKKDPGVLKEVEYITKKGGKILFINALAANDPDSTKKIIDSYRKKEIWIKTKYLMVNNRKDRISRMKQFENFTLNIENDFEKIIISGENKRNFCKGLKTIEKKLEIVDSIKYFDDIEEEILIFAIGNICGEGKKIVEKLETGGGVDE